MTDKQAITERDKALARQCAACPLCKRARIRQKGLAFWFVKQVEGNICPACRAYEKVYGRPAHAPEVNPAKV